MILLGRQVYPIKYIHGGIQREKDYHSTPRVTSGEKRARYCWFCDYLVE